MAIPGEWLLSDQPVEINSGRRTCRLKVRNTGDRPIQIGSHYHFFEANRALDFERPQAIGMHLNIPGGAAVRFEPGDEKEVELVEYGGMKRVVGFNNLLDGGLTSQWAIKEALERARDLEFKGMEGVNPNAAAIVQHEGGEDQGHHVSAKHGDSHSTHSHRGKQGKSKQEGKS